MSFYSDMMQERQLNYPKTRPLCCKKAHLGYKGERSPRCCGGGGCQVCWMIFKAKRGFAEYRKSLQDRQLYG